jgi:PAS domain S-box-containing protein
MTVPRIGSQNVGTAVGTDNTALIDTKFHRDAPALRFLKKIAIAAGLLLIYFAAGKLGLRLASVNASVSPIWPPTGIALAALLIFGYEFWPVILIGAFLVNITTTSTLLTSISIAFGNTLEALLGAYLVNRFAVGRQAMAHVASVFRFALLGGLTSTAVSATIGVMSLCLGHLAAWNQFSSAWLTWWLGDSAGALTWTPFLLLWITKSDEFRRWRWWLELAAFGACLLLASELVSGPYSPLSTGHYPVEFVLIPLLVWPAFRSGPRGTAAAILLISTATIWRTIHGFGAFVRANENESLLLLQTFTGVVSVTSLAVAAVVSERAEKEQRLREAHNAAESLVEQRTAALRDVNAKLEAELRHRSQAEERVRASEERYRLLFKRSMAGICLATPEGGLLECNDSFAQILGYDSAEELEKVNVEAVYFKPEERTALVTSLLQRGKLNNVELHCRRKDGTAAWLLSNLTVMKTSDKGAVIQSSSVDISEIKRAQEELRHLSAKLMNSQDDERRNIARELHDSVGQYLAAVSMALESAKNDPGALPRRLDEAAEIIRQCLREIRTISHLLHPPLLDELGLSSAVKYYVEGFAARSEIRVQIEIPEELVRMGDNVEILLFRVLQESLTNVHRHSGSRTATVKIGADSQKAWLEVQDQGKGTGKTTDGGSSEPFIAGMGITGMRERVRNLGGTTEITADLSGTRVRVVVPWAAERKINADEKASSAAVRFR